MVEGSGLRETSSVARKTMRIPHSRTQRRITPVMRHTGPIDDVNPDAKLEVVWMIPNSVPLCTSIGRTVWGWGGVGWGG